jgi:hypothetical protein
MGVKLHAVSESVAVIRIFKAICAVSKLQHDTVVIFNAYSDGPFLKMIFDAEKDIHFN